MWWSDKSHLTVDELDDDTPEDTGDLTIDDIDVVTLGDNSHHWVR